MPNPLTKEAPYKGPGADSEEKHEPASDIDTALVDSLKVLDPEGPIREADMGRDGISVRAISGGGRDSFNQPLSSTAQSSANTLQASAFP